MLYNYNTNESYIYIYIYIHIMCIYIYIYTHTYIHTCIHTYMCNSPGRSAAAQLLAAARGRASDRSRKHQLMRVENREGDVDGGLSKASFNIFRNYVIIQTLWYTNIPYYVIIWYTMPCNRSRNISWCASKTERRTRRRCASTKKGRRFIIMIWVLIRRVSHLHQLKRVENQREGETGTEAGRAGKTTGQRFGRSKCGRSTGHVFWHKVYVLRQA